MTTNVGDLQVDLSFNDKGFTLTTRRAGEVIRTLQKDMSRTAEAVEKMEAAHHSLGRMFRNFMITVASVRFAMMDFNQVVLGIPRAVMKTSGELERMMMLMKGLSKETTEAGRAAEATRGFNFIINMAQKAPFEIKSLTDAFVKLKSAGIEPMDGMLQGLVDSVAKFGGTSETLHRASIAIQQMAGKGVISMEELRQQLGEAVPNAMQLMARASGVSMAELIKQISKGRVESFAALQNLSLMMQAENRGAAQAMMQTWTGTLSQIKTQFDLLAKEVGDSGLFELIKSQARDLLAFMRSDAGKQFAQGLGRGLAETALVIRDVAKSLYDLRNVIVVLGTVLVGGAIAEKLKTLWTSTIGAMVRQTSQIAAEAAQVRQFQLAKELKVEQEASVARAGIITAELERKRIQLAAWEAEYAAHAARVATMQRNASLLSGATSPGVAAAQQARIAAQQAEAWAAARRVTALQEGVKATQEALVAERAHAAAISNGAAAAVNAAGKIGFAAQATIVWRGALAALGGPIGALITALSIGIPLWMMWGNKGEEAIKRVKAALESGTATRKDESVVREEIAKLEKQITLEQKLLDNMGKNATEGERKLRIQNIQALRAEIKGYELELAEINRQALSSAARSGAEAATQALDEQQRKMDEIFVSKRANLQRQIREIEVSTSLTKEAREKQLEDLRKQDADLVKQQFAAETQNIADRLERVADVERKIADGTIKATADQSARVTAARKELERRYLEAAKRSSDAAQTLGTFRLLDPKNLHGEKKGEDPLTAMLERAKGDLDSAQIKLEDMRDGIVTFNALYEAEMAKLQSMRRAGRFDTKDDEKKVHRPGEDDKRIQQIADLTAFTEAVKRNAVVFAGLARDQAALDEQLAESQERMANGGENTSGVYERLARSLAKTRLQMVAVGDSVDEFNKKAEKQLSTAAMIDVNNFISEITRKNDDLRAEGILNERSRAETGLAAYKESLTRRFEAEKKKLLDSEGDNQKTTDKIQEMWIAVQQNIAAMTESMRRRTMSQLERWVETAQDYITQIDGVTTGWAGNFLDAIIATTNGAKDAWKNMVISMANDLLRLTLNKTLAGPLGQLAGAAGNWLTNLFSGGGQGYGTAGSNIPEGPFPFAKGGIMTELGPVALRRYANGGIARDTQLAMFGEGSRPEAYVPLPDGRTIPVSVKGGAANVVVNVINQSGQPVSAQQQGGPRFDGTKTILDIVLTAASQPGNFRDGMRGAMRS